MTELHYSIDLAAHCQALSRMNPQGRDAAFLYREIASRVLDILQFMRMAPEKILYHTVGFDDGAKQLAKRYPDAEITVVSALPLSLSSCEPNSRIQYYCAKNLNLPFEKESFDLLVSNLMLHWQPNPSHYLKTCYLSLRARGLLLFSTLGPDTLHELHDAFSQVDEKPHIHEFIDMHHIGDALLHHQFIEPVMDMEQLTVHYRTLNRLFSDIKAIGAKERNLKLSMSEKFGVPPIKIPEYLVELLRKCTDYRGIKSKTMMSGALHDSCKLAAITDIGMIFVPSKDGRSHCPEEWTDWEHIKCGAEVLLDAIVELAK